MKTLRFIPAPSLEVLLLRRLKNESVIETHRALIEKTWNRTNYLGPQFFGPRSSQNVHWICQKGHRFIRPIGRITRASDNGSKFGGCPYCSGQTPHESESLASVPELASQWMEKENGCVARFINVNSSRPAQWQCPTAHHTYVTKVCTRTAGGQGCPSCYQGPRVNLSVFDGANRQYVRTKRNRGFDPSNLPRTYKVYWRCHTYPEHSWYESFEKLERRRFVCKKCDALEKSATSLIDFPGLVSQFDRSANENLDPKKIAAASHISVTWKCPAGPDHIWQARVFHRTINKSGCPFCANKRVSTTNCLVNVAPSIAADFHPTSNGNTKANDVVASSCKPYWWLCQFCSHEWQMTARERTGRKRGCPKCETNSLTQIGDSQSGHSQGFSQLQKVEKSRSGVESDLQVGGPYAGKVLTSGRDSKRGRKT